MISFIRVPCSRYRNSTSLLNILNPPTSFHSFQIRFWRAKQHLPTDENASIVAKLLAGGTKSIMYYNGALLVGKLDWIIQSHRKCEWNKKWGIFILTNYRSIDFFLYRLNFSSQHQKSDVKATVDFKSFLVSACSKDNTQFLCNAKKNRTGNRRLLEK